MACEYSPVLRRLVALADAAWNCGTFHDPNTVFIAVDCYLELHAIATSIASLGRKLVLGFLAISSDPIFTPPDTLNYYPEHDRWEKK